MKITMIIVALATVLLGASWSAGPASAAIKLVKLESQGGAKLAAVKKLKCKVNGKGFTAVGKDSGWKLTVRIQADVFDGFHRYDLEYDRGRADFYIKRGDTLFGNLWKPRTGGPPGPELTVGGAISFPKSRKVLAIGFPFVYDGEGPSTPQIASFVGEAPCKY